MYVVTTSLKRFPFENSPQLPNVHTFYLFKSYASDLVKVNSESYFATMLQFRKVK